MDLSDSPFSALSSAAVIIAGYYAELMRLGVPADAALALTRDFQETLMTGKMKAPPGDDFPEP
jgi:hypothetical protein